MRLRVSINGQLVVLPTEDSTTISQLKEKIKSRISDVDQGLELYLDGGKLFGDDTIGSLGLKDTDILIDRLGNPPTDQGNAAAPPPSSSSSSEPTLTPTPSAPSQTTVSPHSPSISSVTPSSSSSEPPVVAGSSSSSTPKVSTDVLVNNPDLDLKEIIVVVFDISSSMDSTFVRIEDEISKSKLTRLAASKVCFGAFIDKTIAFEYAHAIGLIVFGKDVTQKLPIVRKLDKFEEVFANVVDTEPATYLFQAIEVAIDKINEHRNNVSTKPKCRVIAFTDGGDNSGMSSYNTAHKAIKANVVVDGVLIGGNDNEHKPLRCLVHSTGGMSVRIPQDEATLSTIFEREPILALSERRASPFPPSPPTAEEFSIYGDLAIYPYVSVELSEIKEAAPVVKVKAVKIQTSSELSKIATKSTNASQKRILKEYQDIIDDPHPLFEAFIDENDVFSWKIVLDGPAGTSYLGGTWILEYNFPSDYPFKPPKVQFLNKIYHTNINDQGRLCLDILKDAWSPALTTRKVMLSILALLTDPNPHDALDAWKGMLCKMDRPKYEEEIVKSTRIHASTPKPELKSLYNLS